MLMSMTIYGLIGNLVKSSKILTFSVVMNVTKIHVLVEWWVLVGLKSGDYLFQGGRRWRDGFLSCFHHRSSS